jgi:hypothetical protein
LVAVTTEGLLLRPGGRSSEFIPWSNISRASVSNFQPMIFLRAERRTATVPLAFRSGVDKEDFARAVNEHISGTFASGGAVGDRGTAD